MFMSMSIYSEASITGWTSILAKVLMISAGIASPKWMPLANNEIFTLKTSAHLYISAQLAKGAHCS